jgi:hypothetical protein
MLNGDLNSFIARWSAGEGGQERANYALFLSELCDVLEVPRPDQASYEAASNAYAFERAVTFREPDGSTARGRIDLYKRSSFVLEAKQSRRPGGAKAVPEQGSFLGLEPKESFPRGRRTASRAWDVLMLNARQQAEDYAKALPPSEGWPPFLIVCDVGHCFEIYADFTGQGKNYAQFPDRQGFRIYLEELREEKIRDRLRLIWLDPHKLDPTKIAAKATREVAERLAKVSKHLEEAKGKDGTKLYDPEAVALFLMRCLFTMFAEDVELLPKGSFRDVLKECTEDPALFPRLVGQLWEAMDVGGFAFALKRDVKKFNGYLFKDRAALPLPREEIGELYEAAKADWRQVEPAIFGTLLEQALNPAERRKLGAHYTPRAYVERLVIATVLEPLKAEWLNVQTAVEVKRGAGDAKGAITEVQKFHQKLCELRILDPACGTGNFLYVSLELLKRLEGEVLEALDNLKTGDQEALLWLQGHGIDPHQFLGLEVNPRARAIAELVLWIGFLQWHFRTRSEAPAEPILQDFKKIETFDSVLAAKKELARDERGRPLSRVDAEGNELAVWRYTNPKRPEWPVADYIVGNPPFIGKGAIMRAASGDEYVEALWAAHPHMNESADFVMYWWDKAAELLTSKGTQLKRFGFVTTNSITQVFNRRVVERHFNSKPSISLLMAIPDHPWTKATRDAAAVRIAMTVATIGKHEGQLFEVTREANLDTDEPIVELSETRGRINADLTIGADVTSAYILKANGGLSCNGMMLSGSGFILTPSLAEELRRQEGKNKDTAEVIRPYINGGDLVRVHQTKFVIDLFGRSSEEVRSEFPHVYQHVLQRVKPDRDLNRDSAFRERWWLYGRSRPELRGALIGSSRFIATTETAKHRVFQFLPSDYVPDHMIIAIALDDAFFLGVLSSRYHVVWALRAGGWLGIGNDPRYSKSRVFDPFPFPDPSEALKARIRETAEELDALRKQVQVDHPRLTLTQIYNVLEKLRAGLPLEPEDEEVKTQGLVLILKELHDKLDTLVAEAYGWPANLSDDEILTRLVALNAERAEEERRGLIRWLRPDYQRPRAGLKDTQAAVEADAQTSAPLIVETGKVQKPSFPASDLERAAVVMAMLTQAREALDAKTLAKSFKQGSKAENAIARVLTAFAQVGQLHTKDGKAFALRRSP